MNNKLLLTVSLAGILSGVYGAYVFSQRPPAQPPLFSPATNPYEQGIYANGIIESYQSHGENINIYPEVAGPVTAILVSEGQQVRRGETLLTIDDSVQRATAEQAQAQAQAAAAVLEELKAQPRPETLAIARAQVEAAKATLKHAGDQLSKREQAYRLSPGTLSLDDLDNARNAVSIAQTNLDVVQRQFELTAAGAWAYDVQNQEKQQAALAKAYESAAALVKKYTLLAPVDGVILSIGVAAGSYVSPQGAFDTYTQAMGPLIVMGTAQDRLQVRCFVDEILVHRLPEPEAMTAQMFLRGTDIHIPLTFERLQPYISPKIELSNQRQERVDVRVLPVIFRLQKPEGVSLFPGQLVDVYIGRGPSPAQEGGSR